jgi:hypothetical protein
MLREWKAIGCQTEYYTITLKETEVEEGKRRLRKEKSGHQICNGISQRKIKMEESCTNPSSVQLMEVKEERKRAVRYVAELVL